MLEQRKFAGARDLLERAVAVTIKNRSSTNDYLALLYANLGLAERGLGQASKARVLLEKALRVAEVTRHRNLALSLQSSPTSPASRSERARGWRS